MNSELLADTFAGRTALPLWWPQSSQTECGFLTCPQLEHTDMPAGVRWWCERRMLRLELDVRNFGVGMGPFPLSGSHDTNRETWNVKQATIF